MPLIELFTLYDANACESIIRVQYLINANWLNWCSEFQSFDTPFPLTYKSSLACPSDCIEQTQKLYITDAEHYADHRPSRTLQLVSRIKTAYS